MTRALLAGLVASLLVRSVFAQGYSPDQAASHMTVPEGIEVKLVASEPTIRQPVCIEFDDRGRLWVIQYLQYPNPAGLSRVKVDRFSRTVYDKMPEPPPRGERGADRITILEDADGDGTPEKAKDFVDGLNITSGLAFGHGGVFVLNPPYLLFYADKNRDDKPDGDPDVLLTGFGLEDAHSVANSLTWGPDGWLYGCQGSTVTANIRGVEFQQGVWRYHPLTKKFELFCEGGGNSWGIDFDPHGNLVYNTNFGGYVMLHAVQGAYYWKQFNKHGGLHNPFAYGYFDHVPHANFKGGHVSVGGIIYHGGSLPEKYHGKYITADLLDHRVWWHDMTPDKSSFKTAQGSELLIANDTWFASTDFTMGPDGAVYVSDFHDQRTAHPDPDAEWDRRNGRVYRIAAKETKPYDGRDISKLSNDELIALLSHQSNWFSRRARRVLADRRDASVYPTLQKMIADGGEKPIAVEALWALYASGGVSSELTEKCLSHPNADVRWWTVRLLGDEEKVSPAVAKRFVELAKTDESLRVRSQLASTAKRLPADDGLAIVEQLVLRDIDANDPHIPMLLWWAVEHHAIPARDRVIGFFTSAAATDAPIARDVIVGRLTRRYAAEGTTAGLDACAALLAKQPLLLPSLDLGLAERSGEKNAKSASLDAVLNVLWRDDTTDDRLIRIFARLGSSAGVQRAMALATDTKQPATLRVAMLELLGEFARPNDVPALLQAMSDAKEPEPLKLATLAALRRFDDARIAPAILAAYASQSPVVRARSVDLMLSRKESALIFVKAVDAGQIAAGDVTMEQLRQVALFQDRELNTLVQKKWGRITGGTPEEKLAEVRRFNNDLRAAAGNPAAGKEVFKTACAVCHKLFDEGGLIGPDLTHANRADRDYLLVSIVDPSSVVRAEHLSFLIRTKDGRVLTGLMVEQSAAGVTLLDAKGEKLTVAREKIDVLKESPVSLMPEGLLTGMKPQELRDLFSYLQGNGK
jgi:putative membrane-bound dehydrogenase-like protein